MKQLKYIKSYEAFTTEMPEENPNGIEQENKHKPGDRSIENSFGVNTENENETESPKESESEKSNNSTNEDSENQ